MSMAGALSIAYLRSARARRYSSVSRSTGILPPPAETASLSPGQRHGTHKQVVLLKCLQRQDALRWPSASDISSLYFVLTRQHDHQRPGERRRAHRAAPQSQSTVVVSRDRAVAARTVYPAAGRWTAAVQLRRQSGSARSGTRRLFG